MSELQNSKALERLRQNGISNPKELLQNTSSINIVIESNCHSRVLKNARAFILYESMIQTLKQYNQYGYNLFLMQMSLHRPCDTGS